MLYYVDAVHTAPFKSEFFWSPSVSISKQYYVCNLFPLSYTFIWQQITSLQRYYKNDSHLTNYGCHHWDTNLAPAIDDSYLK